MLEPGAPSLQDHTEDPSVKPVGWGLNRRLGPSIIDCMSGARPLLIVSCNFQSIMILSRKETFSSYPSRVFWLV